MRICETRIDKILSSPETKLVESEGLTEAFVCDSGTIEVERIARRGTVRYIERRLYGRDGDLLEVDTLSIITGKVRTEDATSYEHRKAKEDAEEAKTAISIKIQAWAKENRKKQERIDRLGQAMGRLRGIIESRQAELQAVQEEFSMLMAEKREFLQEGG